MGFWASTATVIGVIGGTAGAIWLGIHFGEKWIDRMFALPAIDASKGISVVLQKRPVAFRVKDYADGWIIYQDEKAAYDESERTGAVMQGLYVRDGDSRTTEEKP